MRKLLLPILVFGLVLSSCSGDLTSLNDDPKSTAEVPAEPLFSNAMVSLGTLQISPDYNWNIAIFMAQYWAQTTYPDETQYDLTNRTIPSNYWQEIYTNVLKDLDDASALVEDEQFTSDAAKANKQAQINIIEVMAYYKLVTTFGNIPYSEALDEGNPSPAYDGAETVYADLLTRLGTAIGNITPGAGGFVSGDIFYGGDLNQWVKLAQSLRMRLAMTAYDNPPADMTVQDLENIIADASGGAFESNDDNVVIGFTPPPPNTNPIWEELVQSGRNDFVPANTLVDFMNDVNDPRRPIHFTLYDTDGDDVDDAYVGGIYGAGNDYSSFSHVTDLVKLQNFEGIVMGYDEVEFLRAEAAVRGIIPSSAQQHYDNAVTADMNYWSNALARYEVGSAGDEVDAGELAQYLTTDAPFPAAGSQQDQLKAIAEQKWIAQYPHVAHQAWVDYRRLDHPTFNLATTVSTEDEIPVRWTYPIDEQNLNQSNWESASDAIGGDQTSTHLFWDTGDATSVQ